MRAVSGKDFCKALERAGWELDRTSGSHHIYKRTGDPTLISVPVHGNQDLARGLQRALMRQARLTEADL